MSALSNLKGQSTTKHPRFNGQYYGWWKTRMHDFIMTKDSELWDIILDGPHVPMNEVKEGEITRLTPKTRRQYKEFDRQKIEKNQRADKLLVCGIGLDEYNRISTCESAKEIRKCLKIAHEGTSQVFETTQYENFNMMEGETTQKMHTRFTSITNELYCPGETIHPSKQV